MSADQMSPAVLDAVRYALTDGGWREEDVIGLLRGCARYANGIPVAVCERCRRPEYEDGLIATEVIDDGDDGGVPIVSCFLCPRCKAQSGGVTRRPSRSRSRSSTAARTRRPA